MSPARETQRRCWPLRRARLILKETSLNPGAPPRYVNARRRAGKTHAATIRAPANPPATSTATSNSAEPIKMSGGAPRTRCSAYEGALAKCRTLSSSMRFGGQIGNGTTIASTMLAPSSALSMLSASLRPGLWPGLRALTTPARGTDWQLRDGGHLMTVHNDVDATITRAYGGPHRQCRTALLRFATTASEARIPPTAPRARSGAHPGHLRSLVAASPRAVGCTMRLRTQCLSRRRVLRTTRRKRQRSAGP